MAKERNRRAYLRRKPAVQNPAGENPSADEMEQAWPLAMDHGEGICCFRADSILTYANDVFCRILGRRRNDVLGRSWKELAHPDEVARVEQELQALRPENPVVVIENRVRSGGAVRWMQFVNRGFFDELGVLKEVRAVSRDVTGRIHAEQALRESNERWRFALEGAGDGVWDWDATTDQVMYSKRWKEMLGYGDNEVEGNLQAWASRVHPDDLPGAKAGIEAHFRGETETYIQEFRMRCRDGSWKWVLARGKALKRDAEGRPLRVIGTHTDISAAKVAKEREADNLRLVAEGAPCSAVLEAIVRSVEAEHPGMLCKVVTVQAGEERPTLYVAPSLPAELMGTTKNPKGSLGECCLVTIRSRQRVVKECFPRGRGWERERKAGLASCWSEPIVSRSGAVLGAFTSYRRKPHTPTPTEVSTVKNAVALAAVAIEREREEMALRESERNFRAIFEQAAVGVAVIDTEQGRFVEVNQRLCEILGVSREELTGSAATEFTHPADRQAYFKLMKELVDGRLTRFNLEKRSVKRDGAAVWLNLDVSPLWQPEERPGRHLVIVQDITARKSAEENYRREMEYNRALVTTTSAYLAAIDVEGRFVHVNRSFLAGMGYSDEDVLGRTPWALGMMDESETERSKARFENLIQGGDNPPVEVRLRAKSGEWRAVELRSALTRKQDGAPDRVLITGTDLTERNRLQQEVLNVVEREQARLGHDLHDGVGQTMTGIVALMDALALGLKGAELEDALRIRELIQEAIQELRRMSHGLSPTSVKNRGLGGSLRLLAETVEKNHRTPCECHVDSELPLPDSDAQTHLYRIAQEAVNNAMKHGHPRWVSISLTREPDGKGLLRVEDDGVGLPRSVRSKRKEPAAPPTGIGLRVMEYRANLIGADLRVTPRKGGGVVVSCRFEPGMSV